MIRATSLPRWGVASLLSAALLVAVAACSSSGGGGSSSSAPAANSSSAGSAPATGSSSGTALSGSITVSAAASLTGTFTQLAKSFEAAHPGTTVTVNFGSSGDLATQITQGAPVDVFASAAPKNMQTVISAGDASNSTNFVSNSLEIATPPSNPGGVTQLSDLAKSGVKTALCVLTAPCGATADTMFKNAHLTVNPVTRGKDVKSTLTLAETGEADAAVVYVTDVQAAGSKVKGVQIPSSSNVTTEYPIAALTHSKNASLASAFVSYIQTPDSLSVLSAAGFAKP